MRKIILISMLVITGCTANYGRNFLIEEGLVRFEPIDSVTADYRFFIQNGSYGYWDTAIKEDRAKLVGEYLLEECSETTVIRERTTTTGENTFGTPARLYTLDVKCEKES